MLLFRALHSLHTLYIQDNQMHNNVPRNYFFVFYYGVGQTVTNGRFKAVRHIR